MTLESLGSHASNVAGALVAIYLVYQFVKGQFAIRDLREMEDCEDKWEKSRAESYDMIEKLKDRLGDVWNELTKAREQASSANAAHHDAEIQCVKLREEIAAMTAEAARLAEKDKADTGAANAQWTQWLGMHEEELAAEKEKVANLTMSYERLHGQAKRHDGQVDELCQRVYSAHRKILAIRNTANRPVYPGGLKQLDADLRDVQDLLEGDE